MIQESPDTETCDAVVVLPVLNAARYIVDAVNDLRHGAEVVTVKGIPVRIRGIIYPLKMYFVP